MAKLDAAKKYRQPKEGSKEAQLRELRAAGRLPKHADIMLKDGAPPDIIRLPGETRAPSTKATAAISAKAPKVSEREKAKREIDREAGERYRNWLPDAEHPHNRPKLATFRKAIRAERKAAADAELASKVAAIKTAKATAKAEQPQENAMTTKSKKSAKTKARTAVKGKTEGVRPGSKLEIVVGLLTRAQGCTAKDILKATEWPSVSVPQQAKAAGLKLVKEKDGKVTRYRAAKAA